MLAGERIQPLFWLVLSTREDGGSPLRSYPRHVCFCLLIVGMLLAGCATGQIRDGAYINEAKGFTIRLPSDAWKVEMDKEPDLLLRHRSRQAGIFVNATCGKVPPNRRLEIVSRHLFFGIRGKEILRQERSTATQGEALDVLLRGEVGGQELLLHGYTLKGPGCVYDLVLFAPPESYSEANGEFEILVRRFQLLRGEKR